VFGNMLGHVLGEELGNVFGNVVHKGARPGTPEAAGYKIRRPLPAGTPSRLASAGWTEGGLSVQPRAVTMAECRADCPGSWPGTSRSRSREVLPLAGGRRDGTAAARGGRRVA
jgi:hypothetical protein